MPAFTHSLRLKKVSLLGVIAASLLAFGPGVGTSHAAVAFGGCTPTTTTLPNDTVTPTIFTDEFNGSPALGCSLREAVGAANLDAQPDTIELTNVPATPYELTRGSIAAGDLFDLFNAG